MTDRVEGVITGAGSDLAEASVGLPAAPEPGRS
jgi:hypothetical protein